MTSPAAFDPDVVAAVLAHMADDHGDDSLRIVRAHARPDAVSARMTGLDGAAGEWEVVDAAGATSSVRVPWPNGPITERAEIRREIVALHDTTSA